MKKIIPFKKDIIFKTNVSEITSISLEHTLHFEPNNCAGGEFSVSGEYKITDTSINVEPFAYHLPFDITLDKKYNLDSASIDINDFYYEIINDNVLSVNIEVIMNGLEERLIEEKKEEVREESIEEIREEPIEEFASEIVTLEEPEKMEPVSKQEHQEISDLIEEIETRANETLENTIIENMDIESKEEIMEEPRCIEAENSSVESLFDHMDDSVETYQSYKVYIVRDGDTIESIMEKYSIVKEELEAYNDIREIHMGDKIIIPFHA